MRTVLLLSCLAAALLFGTSNLASAQFSGVEATSILLDNEIDSNLTCTMNNFDWNPLILNGKPLDYTQFSILSTGLLYVVKGTPATLDAEKIPFRIYLRRDGVIINQGRSSNTRAVYHVEISDVLKLAMPGDHLIIDPVRKENQQAKRIIEVIEGHGDGC